MTATKTAPVAMPATEWRRAVIGSDLPWHARVVAAQLAHFALTDADCLVRPPSLVVLAECAELPHRAVLDAVALLRRTGWTVQVADPDHPDDGSVTCLTNPRPGAR